MAFRLLHTAFRLLHPTEKADIAIEKQMRKIQITKDLIPDHLIEEILLKLPPKSLVRFKSLSKSLKAIISDSSFSRAHLEKNKDKPPLFVFPLEEIWSMVGIYNHINVLTEEEYLKIQPIIVQIHILYDTGCDGFLFITPDSLPSPSKPVNLQHIPLILWNPSIRKHKILTVPNIKDAEVRFGIGYDPSINDYKIIKLVRKNSILWEFEVFTLKSNQWRPLSYNLSCIIDISKRPVSVKGTMYWLAGLEEKPAIVCFDLANETFRMEFPPIGYQQIYGLMEHQGKLGCFCKVPNPSGLNICIVWVLEDKTWVRLRFVRSTLETDLIRRKWLSSFKTLQRTCCAASLISFDC